MREIRTSGSMRRGRPRRSLWAGPVPYSTGQSLPSAVSLCLILPFVSVGVLSDQLSHLPVSRSTSSALSARGQTVTSSMAPTVSRRRIAVGRWSAASRLRQGPVAPPACRPGRCALAARTSSTSPPHGATDPRRPGAPRGHPCAGSCPARRTPRSRGRGCPCGGRCRSSAGCSPGGTCPRGTASCPCRRGA